MIVAGLTDAWPAAAGWFTAPKDRAPAGAPPPPPPPPAAAVLDASGAVVSSDGWARASTEMLAVARRWLRARRDESWRGGPGGRGGNLYLGLQKSNRGAGVTAEVEAAVLSGYEIPPLFGGPGPDMLASACCNSLPKRPSHTFRGAFFAQTRTGPSAHQIRSQRLCIREFFQFRSFESRSQRLCI